MSSLERQSELRASAEDSGGQKSPDSRDSDKSTIERHPTVVEKASATLVDEQSEVKSQSVGVLHLASLAPHIQATA
jgi:hypothetical protein